MIFLCYIKRGGFMRRKKLNGDKILELLTENILINLNELFENKSPSEFNNGGRYAYVECLEILSCWSHFPEFGISDIEKKYPVT